MGYLAIVFAIRATRADGWLLWVTVTLAIGCGILAVDQ